MCNHLTKDGIKCSISPKKTLCHIHKKFIALRHKQNEIKNLNKTIVKKNNDISTLRGTNKSLKLVLDHLRNENKILKTEVSFAQEKSSEMEEDFNNYSIIKRFELLKRKLMNHIDNVNDTYEIKLFCKNTKLSILNEIFGEQTDYWKYYNTLRLQRNKLCHNFHS